MSNDYTNLGESIHTSFYGESQISSEFLDNFPSEYAFSEGFREKLPGMSLYPVRSSFVPEHDNLREVFDENCPYTSVDTSDTSEHAVPKLEAYLYYNGLRGDINSAPKLIYRTSKDVFPHPAAGSFLRRRREMRLHTIHKHEKLDKDNSWPRIRGETVRLLDAKKIKVTSVDLVRFRWKEYAAENVYENITITTPATIWIGVIPDSTTGDAAFGCAQDILKLLEKHDIDDIDVAFRESTTQALGDPGPVLYAPVDDVHPLQRYLHWVSTPLSFPIAGLNTSHSMQGVLSFYFKDGDDLYGVASRHVFFSDHEGNEEYRYDAGALIIPRFRYVPGRVVSSDWSYTGKPKRNVVLMGKRGFDDLLESLKSMVVRLGYIVTGTTEAIATLMEEGEISEFGTSRRFELRLKDRQLRLEDAERTIVELNNFHRTLSNDWSDIRHRIIGHIVWSPPLTGLNPPDGYSQDVCVIKLDKNKFLPNFRGNAIDLGTEVLHFHNVVHVSGTGELPPDFDPKTRLYQLKDVLSAGKMKDANTEDDEGDFTRFVVKRGFTTYTTFGRINGFDSYQRRYDLSGYTEYVEAAVFPYGMVFPFRNRTEPFSRRGDSGAALASFQNEFVGQLTSSTGTADFSDITYVTPMHWLWDVVVKREFPNAVLFDDDREAAANN